MSGRMRTYDPKETVKNFINLYLESFDDVEYSESTISSENELYLRIDGGFTANQMAKITKMLHVCEDALTNI